MMWSKKFNTQFKQHSSLQSLIFFPCRYVLSLSPSFIYITLSSVKRQNTHIHKHKNLSLPNSKHRNTHFCFHSQFFLSLSKRTNIPDSFHHISSILPAFKETTAGLQLNFPPFSISISIQILFPFIPFLSVVSAACFGGKQTSKINKMKSLVPFSH